MCCLRWYKHLSGPTGYIAQIVVLCPTRAGFIWTARSKIRMVCSIVLQASILPPENLVAQAALTYIYLRAPVVESLVSSQVALSVSTAKYYDATRLVARYMFRRCRRGSICRGRGGIRCCLRRRDEMTIWFSETSNLRRGLSLQTVGITFW